MEPSDEVREATLRWYERFSGGDGDAFADSIATGPGVSVFGTDTEGLGAGDRESWVQAYALRIAPSGWTLRPGDSLLAHAEGTVGFATDTPTAVGSDGSWIPARITAVCHEEDGEWKVVHVHLSVAVRDEDVIRPAD